jgi:hypothetical protein
VQRLPANAQTTASGGAAPAAGSRAIFERLMSITDDPVLREALEALVARERFEPELPARPPD